ncbi:MAG: CGNR zinc finger domain-containing protein [Aestuariivirga sp.]
MISTEKWRAYYSPVGRIRMLAGNPALDLANTVHWRDGALLDFVATYRSLVEWAAVAELLTEVEKTVLLEKGDKHPDEASAVHQQWQSLRASLRAWLPTVDGKDQRLWASQIESSAARSLMAEINSIAGNFSLATFLAVNSSNGPSIQLPLLRSATAIWTLMTFPPAGFVRECEADKCGGFFVDQSRAKPRRWCSMDSCGNRAKAQRSRKSVEGKH